MIRILTSDFKNYEKKDGIKITCPMSNENGLVDQLKNALKRNKKVVFVSSDINSTPDSVESYARIFFDSMKMVGITFEEYCILDGTKVNKAKEYIENASFQLGVNPGDDKWTKAETYLQGEDKGTKVKNTDAMASTLTSIGISSGDISTGKVYQLSTSNLEKMGINNVQSDSEDGYYIIVYDLDNTTAEIYNTIGYDNKYSLTDIQNIEE